VLYDNTLLICYICVYNKCVCLYDLKSKTTISQNGIETFTEGLRISPAGAMQHMHQSFRYQKVRDQTYNVPPN